MPELPDVEHHRRLVAERAAGRRVLGVRVGDPALLEGTTPAGLGRSLTGRTLAAPRRHGKWLLLVTADGADGPTLVVHFRMSGELVVDEDGAAPGDAAVTLLLEGAALAYRTRRRLGGISYLRAGVDPATVTGPLGPDALGLDRSTLAARLEGRRGGLKSALLNQRVVAGLGNELVDEILWRARTAPDQAVGDLTHAQLRAVHREMGVVLRQSVRAGRVPSGPTWLNGQRSQPHPRCPHCDALLERSRVAGRTTVWCPHEQSGRA